MIKSNVLGLLLIKNLREVTLVPDEIADIINEHLKGDRDTFTCYEDIINRGQEYEPYGRI